MKKKLRTAAAAIGAAAILATTGCTTTLNDIAAIEIPSRAPATTIDEVAHTDYPTPSPVGRPGVADALTTLGQLAVKGRAPKTGYARSKFGKAWTDDNTAPWGGDGVKTRDNILSRDLTNVTCKAGTSRTHPPCIVQSGTLHDPYTGETLQFERGEKTSELAPIDHVVALGDSWQKGAQQLTFDERVALSNDPLNLVVTVREVNSSKGDGDAATYLIPRTSWRCKYVARQVAVKAKYRLWVTTAEKAAITRVLRTCPGEPLPTDADALKRTV